MKLFVFFSSEKWKKKHSTEYRQKSIVKLYTHCICSMQRQQTLFWLCFSNHTKWITTETCIYVVAERNIFGGLKYGRSKLGRSRWFKSIWCDVAHAIINLIRYIVLPVFENKMKMIKWYVVECENEFGMRSAPTSCLCLFNSNIFALIIVCAW